MVNKCRICGSAMKQGGCFREVYEWCQRCESADTEPDFQLVTPTEPLRGWTWHFKGQTLKVFIK